MSLLHTLEHKFGRHAIPGLVPLIAIGQLAVWVLLKIRPEFVQWLTLARAPLLGGEVWRLVTFIFVPGHSHPVWMLIAALLLVTIGRTLEEAWGAFRVNLYVLAGIMLSAAGILLQQQWTLAELLPGGAGHSSGPAGLAEALSGASMRSSFWFGTSIFFAFACIVPDYEILLFMILPLKAKYIALLGAASLLLEFIDSPAVRVPMLFSFLNFFLAFGPALIRRLAQRGQVAARRSRFESAKAPAVPFFHQCASCRKTELDDPKLDFRVAADGEEYCSVCRAQKAAS